jgi:hypothetical protein
MVIKSSFYNRNLIISFYCLKSYYFQEIILSPSQVFHELVCSHYLFDLIYLFIFAVLGFELRAYTLSHSISPFFVMVFSR